MSDSTGIDAAAQAAAQAQTEQGTQETQQPIDPADEVRGNPAWGEILDKTPSQLHPMMIPVFQRWDKNFQDVQTKYAPYKDLVDGGIQPQDIQASLNVMRLLNENPRAVFDQMLTTFGPQWGVSLAEAQAQQNQEQQAQGVPQDSTTDYDLSQSGFDISKDPRYQEMQQKVDTVAQFFAQQIEADEKRQIEEALDREVAELEAKHGQFNKQIVFALAANGMPLEQAVETWKGQAAQMQPAPGSNFPPVMTPGGGSPSQAVDVSSLSSQDTIGLVKSWIQNAKKEQ